VPGDLLVIYVLKYFLTKIFKDLIIKVLSTTYCVRLCIVVRKIRLIKILPILSFIETQELNYNTKGNRNVMKEQCNRGMFT